MLIGSHIIIQSKDADADKAFLRDVLALSNIDSGGGWLIFGLPPSEVAVHPSSQNDVHEFYLICDDVEAFVAQMKQQGVECSPIQEQRWGHLVQITLPGGGKLGVYQALHARPDAAPAKAKAKPKAKAKAATKAKAPTKPKPKAKSKGKPPTKTKIPTKPKAKVPVAKKKKRAR
jgi:hypothetical protein